ncbi:MAG: hypothetical protein M3O70_12585, partial [Actinomycetota bacterium]|nr:hypothetical protein [Actinomycetota bacterium]
MEVPETPTVKAETTDWLTTKWLIEHAPAVLTVLGVAAYAVVGLAYELFYTNFDVRLDEVGLG